MGKKKRQKTSDESRRRLSVAKQTWCTVTKLSKDCQSQPWEKVSSKIKLNNTSIRQSVATLKFCRIKEPLCWNTCHIMTCRALPAKEFIFSEEAQKVLGSGQEDGWIQATNYICNLQTPKMSVSFSYSKIMIRWESERNVHAGLLSTHVFTKNNAVARQLFCHLNNVFVKKHI